MQCQEGRPIVYWPSLFKKGSDPFEKKEENK